MDLVIHSAVKGVGPYAIAESIVSWHHLEWQRKENMWARHIIQQLDQPSLFQQPVRRDQIEKCPEYYSIEMGGCTPSGKWLTDMFCTVIQRKRYYYDSECIKRARTSKILAIDASYKVPKWMMKWGSDRIYDALHSGTNEYNEIIMQRFSTSDNHLELGSNLETLNKLGLNPFIAFTDDPGRDKSLLKRIFSNLDNGEEEVEENIPEDLVEMSSYKTILYLFRFQEVVDTLSRFRADLEDALANSIESKVKVAFDTEWPVYFEGDQSYRQKRNGHINILQLGSNVTDYTLVIELYNFTGIDQPLRAIGQKLRAIFSLEVSCFTGCN